MSMPRQSIPSGSSDLETTVELPALHVTAYEAEQRQRELVSTDTWVAPAPDTLRPGSLDDDPTLKQRTLLDGDLGPLAGVRELEARLAAGDARLTALEGELEAARRERIAADERAGALDRELTETRSALRTARAQVDELTQRLETRLAEPEPSQARERVLALRLAERERSLARAEEGLHHLQAQAAAHLEALRSLEGRQGVLDTLLRGLDGEVSRRDSRVEELGRELQAARESDRRRIGELQAELAGLRSELTERTAALRQAEARREEDRTQLDAGATRVREIETRLAEQGRTLESLQGEARASRERMEAADDDVRAAEESLHQLDAEIRAKDTRIEELTQLNDDWRAMLEEARRSLDERDGLIRRLEAQTARSTALIESIQQGFDRPAMTLPGIEVAGMEVPRERAGGGDPALETATSLLVRAQGDGEEVHVLGRRTSIGRTPDNDIQIDTRFVSRHHAMILVGPLQTVIEDLHSTNGVIVNGRRITRQGLMDGDTVVLGNSQFRFVVRPPVDRRTTQ